MRPFLLLCFTFLSVLTIAQERAVPCDDNISCAFAKNIVIPTSGTPVCVEGCNTGMPKGPIITGAGHCEFMANPVAWYSFNTGDNNRAEFQVTSSQLTGLKYALFSSCDTWIDCDPSLVTLEPDTDYRIAVTDDNGLEGNFELCLSLYHATDSCISEEKIEVIATSLGSPLSGPFQPCEVITFEYTIDFNKRGNNWIHSIVPAISNCFDYEQNSEPSNADGPDGNADWEWFPADSITWKPEENPNGLIGINQSTGKLCMLGSSGCLPFTGGDKCAYDGTALPGAWVSLTHSDDCDSNRPNLSWGDSYDGDYVITFDLQIPCSACTDQSCNDYTVSMTHFADGQTGGFLNNVCAGNALVSKKIQVKCCTEPTLVTENRIICSKSSFSADITLEPSNSTIEWTVPELEGISGAFSGSGTAINQTLQNDSDEPVIVPYSITPISITGCKGQPDTLEITVLPTIITNVDSELIICKDSVLHIDTDPEGGSNEDYVLDWSTGETDSYSIDFVTDRDTFIVVYIEDDLGCKEIDTFQIKTITDPVSMPDNVKLTGSPVAFINNFNIYTCDTFPLAQFYEWSIDGEVMGYGRTTEFRVPYLPLGKHDLCVRATNTCDLIGQELCWQITFLESPLKTDCTGAEYICSKADKTVIFPGTYGLVLELNTGDFCFGNTYGEQNSHWLTFDIAKAGKLWFTIEPRNPLDVDFIVFKKVDELGCYTKESVRCSYAGGGDCNGILGLSPDETDEYEGGGCDDGQNNMLAALDCEVGDVYYVAILAYNTEEMSTFDMEFCGDALLGCDSVVCQTLKSESNINIKSLKLYPNPNEGYFNLDLPEQYYSGNIEIFDVRGIKVHIQEIKVSSPKQEINVRDLIPGMYNVIVRNEKGVIVGNSKMVLKP